MIVQEDQLENEDFNQRPYQSLPEKLQKYLPASLWQQIQGKAEVKPRLISECVGTLSQLLESTTSHLPSSLVEWVSQNPIPGQANGRFVNGTLLFADISGFTAMSEKLSQNGRDGAEEVTTIVNRYFDVMLEILRAYDGHLIRFGGDALLGLFEEKADLANEYSMFGIEDNPFNLPLRPNSATRAVMTAIKMQDAMSQFTHTETSQGVFPLKMSVGVHYGRFFAAQLGDSYSMEYALFGADVNKTAHIESAAKADQVVVDRSTFDLVDPTLLCTASSVPKNPNYLIVEGGFIPDLPIINNPFQTHFPHIPDWATVEKMIQLLDAFCIYLPEGLVPRLVSDSRATEFQGEHRLVANLFANINGLSALVDGLGPGQEQTIIDTLNSYFLTMSTAVSQFGGVINKIDLYDHGEKLLVTFGAPVTHEDDAERATRAALKMMEAIPQINASIQKQHHLPNLKLSQRIGISFGSVFAGFVGATWRHEYTVMGDQVNLAARLMSQAAMNQIIISPNVKRRIQKIGVFQQHGEVHLKGKSKPVPIFELTAVHTTAQQLRGLTGMASELVGRHEESRLLQNKLQQFQSGQGGILSIIGDAGVGKTRLFSDAIKSISLDAQKVSVRCLSYAETVSYSSMQELLRQLCHISHEHTEAQSLTLFQQKLDSIWTPQKSAEERPYLANFLNLPLSQIEQEKINYLDGEGLRQRTFVALAAFIKGAAEKRPLLIIIDDLQWMDKASHTLLTYLHPLSNELPLLWVLLFRPERQKGCWTLHNTLQDEPENNYSGIQLAGLTQKASAQMLSNLLDVDHHLPQISTLVLNRAEGNPLYLEEVIRSLINDGFLQKDEQGNWQLDRQATHSVPDTLEGVLMARLDRLEETCRWSIQVASVIGRTFPIDVLDEVTAPSRHQNLNEPLTQLQLVKMIEENQRQPELVYSFIHSLLQEVAYRSQSVKARTQYHRLIAQYLEKGRQQGWGDVENLTPLIAHHAYTGGDWPRAMLYQIKTGEHAMTLFANEEAIAHYLKALDSAKKLPDSETAVQRLNIHLSLGQIYITTDQYDEATNHLELAENLVESLNDSSAYVAICRWRTRLHELRGEYDEAFKWIERGLTQQVETADVPQIMLLAGLIHIRQGNYEDALSYCHTVLDLAKQQNEVTALARANNLLGITYLRSDSQKAILHFRTAFDLYKQAGDISGQATSHNLIANACFNLGRWTEADFHYRQALEMFGQISDTYNRIMAVNNLGGIALNQGQLDDALSFYKEGVELAHQIGGSAWMIGVFEMNLGSTYCRLQKPAVALNHLSRSADQFEQAGSRDFLPEMMRHQAKAHMLADNLAEAESIINQAFDLAKEQDNQGEMGCSQRVKAEILLDQSQASLAIQELEQSITRLEAVGEEYELAKSRFTLAKTIWHAQKSSKRINPLLEKAQSVFESLDAKMDLTAVIQFNQQIAKES
ncbi:MAG: adenylate/guanylate cyclase domain-containing protein [Chloroflexota bacterium]